MALLVNVPNLILVFEILKNEPDVSQLVLTAMIAVPFFGISGCVGKAVGSGVHVRYLNSLLRR